MPARVGAVESALDQHPLACVSRGFEIGGERQRDVAQGEPGDVSIARHDLAVGLRHGLDDRGAQLRLTRDGNPVPAAFLGRRRDLVDDAVQLAHLMLLDPPLEALALGDALLAANRARGGTAAKLAPGVGLDGEVVAQQLLRFSEALLDDPDRGLRHRDEARGPPAVEGLDERSQVRAFGKAHRGGQRYLEGDHLGVVA